MSRLDSDSPEKIMMICGESSGDLHGAGLVRELFKKNPKFKIFGIGGRLMRREGFGAVLKSEDLSFMGISDVISNYGIISDAKKAMEFLIEEEKPDLLILIDYPGFNLRIAKFAKKHGIKVLYYISPKIWAWNMKRIHKIKEFVDHMALILPFEKEIYDAHEIESTFVGNPLMDYNIPEKNIRDFHEIKSAPIIGLLPGSRPGEVKRHIDVLLKSAEKISSEIENAKFIVSFACEEEREFLSNKLYEYKNQIDIRVEDKSVYNVFEESDFLIAASGTVTLEAAASGVPMVIIYKVSNLTYAAGKTFVKTPYIGLASIIAGREIVPELIQRRANPNLISHTVLSYLEDEEMYGKMVEDLKEVKNQLGEKGVSLKTAELGLGLMKSNTIQEN